MQETEEFTRALRQVVLEGDEQQLSMLVDSDGRYQGGQAPECLLAGLTMLIDLNAMVQAAFRELAAALNDPFTETATEFAV